MYLDLDIGRLVVFLGGFLVFLLIEVFRPLRTQDQQCLRRYSFHFAVAALNTVIIRVLAFVPFLLWAVHVDEQGWGISRWLGLHGWIEICASIVVLDAFDYAWHRANHRVPVLWRFHKAHHADTRMDLSTSLRFHPGELLISALVKAGWIAAWGPTAVAWFLFEALVSLCAQFHHANVDVPRPVAALLGPVLVTPAYHAAHHLVDRRYGDKNFATIFPWWDRLFGTRAEDDAFVGDGSAFGLPEDRETALQPIEWLAEPLRRRNLRLAVYAEEPTQQGPTSGSQERSL